MSILDEITAYKRRHVAECKERRPQAELERAAGRLRRKYNFKAALRRPGQVSLIAEVKKASPSAGLIRPVFDPVAIAEEYTAAGAAALSVLTDEKYFQGSLEHLETIHACVPLPLLRKEFIVDEYQIFEAALSGAAAILLIVACLTPEEIRRFSALARQLDMDVLVEIHDAEELQVAVDCGASIIGINNRNLKTMVTDLAVAETLAPRLPASVVRVGESGIRTREDVLRLQAVGVDAILVGESLMRSGDLKAKVRELLGTQG